MLQVRDLINKWEFLLHKYMYRLGKYNCSFNYEYSIFFFFLGIFCGQALCTMVPTRFSNFTDIHITHGGTNYGLMVCVGGWRGGGGLYTGRHRFMAWCMLLVHKHDATLA